MALGTRHLERIRKKLLIKVEGETCIMEDLSKTGMRLLSSVLFKRKVVGIMFEMEDRLLELDGEIRWIRKESTVYDQVQYQVGVFFPNPPEEYIHLVEKLLEEEE
jgi:hypothetical protein